MCQKTINLYFIRHGRLNLLYKRHEEMPYQVLVDLSTGKLNPRLSDDRRALFLDNAGKIPLDKISVIFYNSDRRGSRRALESAKTIAEILKECYHKVVPIKGNPHLREIKFNVADLVTEVEYRRGGLPLIRERFFQELVNGNKIESFKEAYERVRLIFKDLERFREERKKIILITHDFFMRVVEIYIKSKGRKNIIVSKDEIANTPLNTYFRGFGTSYNLDVFERIE